MNKFLVDTMLGRLAKELRMLGYDTLYYRGKNPHELIELARLQDRILLTRNTKWTPLPKEVRVITIFQDDPVLQLKELLREEMIVLNHRSLFTRCLLCNASLRQMTRENAEGKVPDFIFSQQKEFYQCPQCLKIYWPGSHQERMEKRMRDLFGV